MAVPYEIPSNGNCFIANNSPEKSTSRPISHEYVRRKCQDTSLKPEHDIAAALANAALTIAFNDYLIVIHDSLFNYETGQGSAKSAQATCIKKAQALTQVVSD